MTVLMRLCIVLVLVGFPWIVAASPPDDKAPSLLKTPSEACQSCHKAIHTQWQKSAHGQSRTQSLLFQTVSKTASGCNNCHLPKFEDNKEAFSGDGRVPCVLCHTMESVQHPGGKGEKSGIDAYRLNERVVQGPNGAWFGARGAVPPGSGDEEEASNPFFHNANPEMFRTSMACLGCHDPKKLGDPKAYPVSCQSCHMPVSGGFADHGTPAGKSLRMVKRGPVVVLQARHDGKELDIRVEITNLLPHPFPNGGSFAAALLRVTLLDAKGESLWENVEKKKLDQDPKALFALTTADDLGHPAPPKAMAIQPPKDSRLQPGETRKISYRIQQPLAVGVRAEVIVLPLSPGWLEKLPEGQRELPKGLLAARSEVKLAIP